MMIGKKNEQSISMGIKKMNPILILEEYFLWILEIKEPEHMIMNLDSIYTYSSMKDNTMERTNKKHIHIKK